MEKGKGKMAEMEFGAGKLRRVLEKLDRKQILVLGYGREGRETVRRLMQWCPQAEITVADQKEQALPEGINGLFGPGYQDTLKGYDVIVKSPGIVLRDKSPEVVGKVTSQTELFLAAYRRQVAGITGTKGKSTTSSLTAHILKSVYPDTLLMGNIGIPAFSLAEEMGERTVAVYELSCHQLEYTRVSPHIAVILNLFEEHLDHYGTKEAYFAAKRNIYAHQSPDDLYFCNILQKDDLPRPVSRVVTMEQAAESSADLWVHGREIRYQGHTLPLPPGCTQLEGEHNLYNIGAAYGLCRAFGVTDEQFMAALRTFSPLPHRLQRVGTFGGVTYYDDSISTACETAIGAMEALKAKGIGSVLLGGMDRGIDYTPLCDYLMGCPADNPRYLILMPDSGLRIEKTLLQRGFDPGRMAVADGLEDAVRKAKALTPKGEICLLSPAAASYGFFQNFEERGDKFQEYVRGTL